MADDEKAAEENVTGGNDWEVVSLTASAYAAAPDVAEFESAYVDKNQNEEDPPSSMFMSDHFVFPYQQENLTIGIHPCEIYNEKSEEKHIDFGHGKTNLSLEIDKGPQKDNNKNKKDEELPGSVDLHGLQFFDKGPKKDNNKYKKDEELPGSVDLHGLQFFAEREVDVTAKEEMNLIGLNLVVEEGIIDSAAKYNSVHGAEDSSTLSSTSNCSPSLSPRTPKHVEQYEQVEKSLNCGNSWWRQHITSVYAHAKEANSIWSVVVAAALMGLVILGRKWQQNRWEVQQLKMQLGVNDQRSGRVLVHVSRFKDVLVGGSHITVLKGCASREL